MDLEKSLELFCTGADYTDNEWDNLEIQVISIIKNSNISDIERISDFIYSKLYYFPFSIGVSLLKRWIHLNPNNLEAMESLSGYLICHGDEYELESNFYYKKAEILKVKIAQQEATKQNTPANFANNISRQISTLRDLAQSRPLLIREQIELSFLEKIQAADSLAALQNIENELNNTPTDPELIKKLLKYVADKKAFY